MGSKGKQPAARLGDIDTGHPPAPPTPIITASGNVFINGIPAARKGDMLAPHHPGVRIITEGSGSVKINGMPAARITDAINCGGKIVVGSGNVLIGDTPPSGSPLAPGEWDDYIAASSNAQNPSPVQDQQMRADSAVKYRGKAAAATSWNAYYSDMSPKGRPAPSSIQNPAQRSGLEQANSTPPSPVPTLPAPTQQQIIDSAGQQMVQAIKNLAEGEMVTPEMLSLGNTMTQAANQITDYEPDPKAGKPKAGNQVFRRIHKEGVGNDTYTLMPDGKPLGASAGKMPASVKGMKKKPANHDSLVDAGWPDLNAPGRNGQPSEEYANFTNIQPKNLPPGTKIYRIVDERSGNAGGYWANELPASKTEWRKGYAVKDSWNDNGYYVEYTVGSDGLKVWEGGTAGQPYEQEAGKDFYLQGGATQLYVQPNSIKTSKPQLTSWPEA